MEVAKRIEALRGLMDQQGLAGYIVPSADPHQSEYVARAWQRRAFITGFEGSAGTAAFTKDQGGLWTDFRYFLQADKELQGSGVTLFRQGEAGVPELEEWLGRLLPQGARVGVDPWVFSVSSYDQLRRALEARGLELVSVDQDLVEAVWDDRPAMPQGRVRLHPVEVAGEGAQSKLSRLSQALKEASADAMVLCALDEIAWTFNLRGEDVEYNPVFIAYALIEPEGATLFMDEAKVGEGVRRGLPEGVVIRPYGDILKALERAQGKRIWLDPAVASQRLAQALGASGTKPLLKAGPVPSWKAAKNPTEIQGMREAHIRDGVAMVRFLRWLEDAVPQGGQTELTVEARLAEIREAGLRYLGPSFRTIAGYEAHGAIVHYAASAESSLPLKPQGLLLIDSGGQYQDGTTDITRTVALGEPTEEQKVAYTAVLKGHLRLGRALFLAGTNGYQLDVLARSALWEQRLNYGHGTGHGVGAHLGVHEGPFSVSLRRNLTPLEAGNILSNEPGYYKAEGFGIRIENLVLVVERHVNEWGRFLAFEDLTLCPYDLRLVEASLLEPGERAQVDAYHTRVMQTLSPLLAPEDRRWLEEAVERW